MDSLLSAKTIEIEWETFTVVVVRSGVAVTTKRKLVETRASSKTWRCLQKLTSAEVCPIRIQRVGRIDESECPTLEMISCSFETLLGNTNREFLPSSEIAVRLPKAPKTRSSGESEHQFRSKGEWLKKLVCPSNVRQKRLTKREINSFGIESS